MDDAIALHRRYRRELIRDGRGYLLAYGVLALEPLLLVPLLLTLLRPEEIGVLGAVEALNVVLGGLTQLGVKFAYLQHVADHGPQDRGSGFWSATLLTCAAGALAGAAAAPVLDFAPVAGVLGLAPGIRVWTLAGLLLLTNLQMMVVTDLRANRNPLPFFYASLVRVTVALALLWLLAPRMSSRLDAVFAAQALGLALSVPLLAMIGRIPRWPVFEPRLAGSFVAYGWPVAVGGLLKYGSDALLPWLCLSLVSPLAAGAVALALKISALYDYGFGLPFLMAWGGRVYYIARERTARVVSRLLFRDALLISAAMLVAAWALGGCLLAVTGGDASLTGQAWLLLPLAIAGRSLFILRSPASVGLLATRKMTWHAEYGLAGLLLFAVAGPPAFLFLGATGGWLAFVVMEAGLVWHMYRRSQGLLPQAPAAAG